MFLLIFRIPGLRNEHYCADGLLTSFTHLFVPSLDCPGLPFIQLCRSLPLTPSPHKQYIQTTRTWGAAWRCYIKETHTFSNLPCSSDCGLHRGCAGWARYCQMPQHTSSRSRDKELLHSREQKIEEALGLYLFGGPCLSPWQMQIPACSHIQQSSSGLFSSAVRLCRPDLIKGEQISPV